jgi:hypothetical protein
VTCGFRRSAATRPRTALIHVETYKLTLQVASRVRYPASGRSPLEAQPRSGGRAHREPTGSLGVTSAADNTQAQRSDCRTLRGGSRPAARICGWPPFGAATKAVAWFIHN